MWSNPCTEDFLSFPPSLESIWLEFVSCTLACSRIDLVTFRLFWRSLLSDRVLCGFVRVVDFGKVLVNRVFWVCFLAFYAVNKHKRILSVSLSEIVRFLPTITAIDCYKISRANLWTFWSVHLKIHLYLHLHLHLHRSLKSVSYYMYVALYDVLLNHSQSEFCNVSFFLFFWSLEHKNPSSDDSFYSRQMSFVQGGVKS